MSNRQRHICQFASGLLAPAALLLSSSCNRNEVKDYDISYDLCCEVICTPYTKAEDKNNDYCIWAYDSSTHEAELEAATLVRQGQYWCPQGGYLWESSKILDIYAAAPLSRARLDLESGVCFDSFSISEGVDPLYIEPLMGCRTTHSLGVVSLEFKSALSELRFYVQSNCSNDTQVAIKELAINGLAQSGSFRSLPLANWTTEGDKISLSSFSGSHSVSADRSIVCEQRIIPQSALAQIELVCDFTVNGVLIQNQILTVDYHLNSRPGKLYELCLSIYEDFSLKIEKI